MSGKPDIGARLLRMRPKKNDLSLRRLPISGLPEIGYFD
jgi:hypothetical protein